MACSLLSQPRSSQQARLLRSACGEAFTRRVVFPDNLGQSSFAFRKRILSFPHGEFHPPNNDNDSCSCLLDHDQFFSIRRLTTHHPLFLFSTVRQWGKKRSAEIRHEEFNHEETHFWKGRRDLGGGGARRVAQEQQNKSNKSRNSFFSMAVSLGSDSLHGRSSRSPTPPPLLPLFPTPSLLSHLGGGKG